MNNCESDKEKLKHHIRSNEVLQQTTGSPEQEII